MTALEKVKAWIKTYPNHSDLGEYHIDYTDQVPNNGGIFPNGLIEVDRTADIFGNVKITNQLNFGLYWVFDKPAGDDIEAKVNAEWISDFQQWVQEQSATGKAPVFGDKPEKEKVTAQNGILFETDAEGTATYMVQLSAQYIKEIEVENEWLI